MGRRYAMGRVRNLGCIPSAYKGHVSVNLGFRHGLQRVSINIQGALAKSATKALSTIPFGFTAGSQLTKRNNFVDIMCRFINFILLDVISLELLEMLQIPNSLQHLLLSIIPITFTSQT